MLILSNWIGSVFLRMGGNVSEEGGDKEIRRVFLMGVVMCVKKWGC